jgi:formate--tetrahydrofolate ligase
MQDINMRFTGDIDAVGAAHNLLAAVIDNHLFQGNALGIDGRTIPWRRALDMNDRALRNTVIGLGGAANGVPREDGFMITAASEVMAVLCLSRSYADLKERLGRIIVGYRRDGSAATAKDLEVVGAMAALLRDALEPNLVQTAEGTPALVHGGPFGNIAHGTASLVSILLGLRLSDYCIVEAGFASDLGGEKFVDIAARVGGFEADAAVIVATIRALKHHGGASKDAVDASNPNAVRLGLENLAKHIENVRLFGLEPIVAINAFRSDSRDEIRVIEEFCSSLGVPCALSTAFTDGGEGAKGVAQLALEACHKGAKSRALYALDASTEEKLETLVKNVYGGAGVDYEIEAKSDIERISRLGLSDRPICVSKTQLSLSDDPRKLGRPRGFRVTVQRLRAAAGAGFNIAYMGDILTMPGLPKEPAAKKIDLTDDGRVTGVF